MSPCDNRTIVICLSTRHKLNNRLSWLKPAHEDSIVIVIYVVEEQANVNLTMDKFHIKKNQQVLKFGGISSEIFPASCKT